MKKRRIKAKKRCEFSQNKLGYVDYKDVELLKRFMTDKGRMLAAKNTGLCAAYQRKLTVAIKRARHLSLLPFVNN